MIRKVWYGPLPAGSDGGRSFKCENGALSSGTAVWGRDKLIAADAVSVKTVFKIPLSLRLEVTQPPTKLTSLSQGLPSWRRAPAVPPIVASRRRCRWRRA